MPQNDLEEVVLAASKQNKEHLGVLSPFQEQHRLQFLFPFLKKLTREKNAPKLLGEIQRQPFPPHFEEVLDIFHWRTADSQKATALLQKPLERFIWMGFPEQNTVAPPGSMQSHWSPCTGPEEPSSVTAPHSWATGLSVLPRPGSLSWGPCTFLPQQAKVKLKGSFISRMGCFL